MMDNNLLAGGLIGALMLKQAYDENVRHNDELHMQLLRAIAEANKVTPIPEVVERSFEDSKPIWPFK